MKKLFFILLLSLFTLGLNASESDGNCMTRGTGPGYEPVVGDIIVRAKPCPKCLDYYVWYFDYDDGIIERYICLQCAYVDEIPAQ